MGKSLFYAIAFLGGAIIPIQIAITHILRRETDLSHLQSTFVLYLGGAVAAFIGCLMTNKGNVFSEFELARWWLWTSGFVGVFYILSMFISAPQIGVASCLIFIFIGQLFLSTIMDQYGLLGVPINKVSPLKAIAIALTLVSAVLLLVEANISTGFPNSNNRAASYGKRNLVRPARLSKRIKPGSRD